MGYAAGLGAVQIAQAVEVKGELTQGAQDVGSAMAAHQVGVFAPEFVALSMTAVFDVPVPAHKLCVALGCGQAQRLPIGGLVAGGLRVVGINQQKFRLQAGCSQSSPANRRTGGAGTPMTREARLGASPFLMSKQKRLFCTTSRSPLLQPIQCSRCLSL